MDCPEKQKERWENDLRQAISLNVEHISAYHLIYEEDTPIYKYVKTTSDIGGGRRFQF